MFKLFPGLPGHLGQLRMQSGSGRDSCLIVAMAVPVLEFALLFVIDFLCIVCYYYTNTARLPTHQSIKVVLKTIVRSTEYS